MRQIESLRKNKPRIVIGQPERIVALLQQKKLKIHTLEMCIFDEVDMLCTQKNRAHMHTIMKTLQKTVPIFGFSATYTKESKADLEQYRDMHSIQESLYIPETIQHTHTIVSPVKQGEAMCEFFQQYSTQQ